MYRLVDFYRLISHCRFGKTKVFFRPSDFICFLTRWRLSALWTMSQATKYNPFVLSKIRHILSCTLRCLTFLLIVCTNSWDQLIEKSAKNVPSTDLEGPKYESRSNSLILRFRKSFPELVSYHDLRVLLVFLYHKIMNFKSVRYKESVILGSC